jgi:hypothetical protein
MADLRKFFDLTISTLFLMPTIGLRKCIVAPYGFINAYIRDKDKPEYNGNIHLLFKPQNQELINEFILVEKTRTDLFLTSYDYFNMHYVLVYKIDKKWEKDYEKIVNGKYSKLSNEYKKLIPNRVMVNDGKSFRLLRSLQGDILNRSEVLRNALEKELGVTIDPKSELWEKWNDEKETLDINKIIKTT